MGSRTLALLSQFDDVPAHRFSLWIVRVMLQEILQDACGLALLSAPQMDLGQEKLRMREVRGIDPARALQVLYRRIELPEFEIGHAELRVANASLGRVRVARALYSRASSSLCKVTRTPPRLTSGSKDDGSCLRASRKHSSARGNRRV